MSNICQNKKYHFIYKTTNLLNETFYYGMHSTSNLKDGYVGSGKRLGYSINKHGKENFKCEILEFLPDRETLIAKEIELITEEMLQHPLCMNLKLGGRGGCTKEVQLIRSRSGGIAFGKHLKEDDEFRKLISKKRTTSIQKLHSEGRMKYDQFKGKHHSLESKMLIGKANSIKQIGDKNSQFDTMWITNGIENKKIKKSDILPTNWVIGRKIKTIAL